MLDRPTFAYRGLSRTGGAKAASSRSQAQRRFEQGAAVAPAMRGFDQILGMWHQAKHIAALVDDAGNVIDRTVRICALGIAEHDLAFAFEPGERLGLGEIVA